MELFAQYGLRARLPVRYAVFPPGSATAVLLFLAKSTVDWAKTHFCEGVVFRVGAMEAHSYRENTS